MNQLEHRENRYWGQVQRWSALLGFRETQTDGRHFVQLWDRRQIRLLLLAVFLIEIIAFVLALIAQVSGQEETLRLFAWLFASTAVAYALNQARKPELACFWLSISVIFAIAVSAYPSTTNENLRYFYFAAAAFGWAAFFVRPLLYWVIVGFTLIALVAVAAAAPMLTITAVLLDPGVFLALMAVLMMAGRQQMRQTTGSEPEDLIKSDSLLKTISTRLPEFITITDAGHRMIWASASTEAVIGYTPDELQHPHGLSPLERFSHPDDSKRLVEFLNQPHTTAQSLRIEWRCMHKNGHYVWLETVRTEEQDPNGAVRAHVYVSRDISEQKAAGDALLTERNLLRSLIDSLPFYVYVKDIQSRFLLNNRPHLQVLGLVRQEDVIGKTDADFFPTEMAEEYRADELRIIQTGEAMIGKIERTLSSNQRPIWGLVTKCPLYDGSGRIIGIAGSTLDVSSEIEIREALIASESTKKALLEALPDTIYRFSTDGTILDFNPSHAADSPLPEHVIGKNIAEVMSQEEMEQHLRLGRLALETEMSQIFEYETHIGEAIHHYEARIVASGSDEVTSIIRDVTEQKQAELERLELERLQGALEKEREIADLRKLFTTTLSHEFRTPLATIMSSVELLENYGERMSIERRSESLQGIRAQITYLVNMLNDILTIMQVQGNKLRFSPTPTDVAGFVEPIIKEFQASIGANHTLKLVSAPDVGTVLIDQRLLRYILFNLLSNAIKYSPQQTEITTTLERTEDLLRVRVIDRGIGIPQEDQKKLFEAFHRGRNVKSISGSGLGLKIVRDCADLHFGQVHIDSQENVGTRVTLTLPLHPPRDRIRTTTSEIQISELGL